MGNLFEGDKVKIIDSKKSQQIYFIEEIKNSADGKSIYLLKPDSKDNKVVFYEKDSAHLEKIE